VFFTDGTRTAIGDNVLVAARGCGEHAHDEVAPRFFALLEIDRLAQHVHLAPVQGHAAGEHPLVKTVDVSEDVGNRVWKCEIEKRRDVAHREV
jgi:hypothetical protein